MFLALPRLQRAADPHNRYHSARCYNTEDHDRDAEAEHTAYVGELAAEKHPRREVQRAPRANAAVAQLIQRVCDVVVTVIHQYVVVVLSKLAVRAPHRGIPLLHVAGLTSNEARGVAEHEVVLVDWAAEVEDVAFAVAHPYVANEW